MLALENAGAMLKPGGLLLTNDRLPEVPGGSMRLAGMTDVRYDCQGVMFTKPWAGIRKAINSNQHTFRARYQAVIVEIWLLR